MSQESHYHSELTSQTWGLDDSLDVARMTLYMCCSVYSWCIGLIAELVFLAEPWEQFSAKVCSAVAP